MYYQDYKLEGSVELSNILAILLSDNDADKIARQDGSKDNFIPTKHFKLTINREDVLKNGVVPAADSAKIVPVMEWTYNKNYVTKGTLAMFDILVHNNWKRPVYFASTVPSEQYNGLNSYLYTEGLALRLKPLKVDTTIDRSEQINTPVLYNNLMNKFKWGNVKNASYLDTQSADDVSIFTNLFNTAMSGLLKEGRKEDAKKVADRYFEVMPDRFYGMRSTMGAYFMSENLYAIGDVKRANQLIEKTAVFIKKELDYLADVSESKKKFTGGQNVQLGMSFLNQMANIAAKYKQTKLSKDLTDQFNYLEGRFNKYFAAQ
jgi:hypothetical protein